MIILMDKIKLISLLEKTKYWEDEFILKYDNSSFYELLKTLPKDKFNKISALLKKNISDTKIHIKIIEKLALDLKNGKYNL